MRDRPLLSQVTLNPLSRTLRTVPGDLWLSVLYATFVGSAVGFGLVESVAARTALGLPLLLFLPGHVLVAALFPAERAAEERTGVGAGHRLALAFGVSLALLPVLGVALAISPFGFDSATVLAVLAVAVLGGALLASLRRARVPVERRYAVSPAGQVTRFRSWLFAPSSSVDVAINGLLAVAVLVAVSAVGYAVVAPNDGSEFTDFYVDENGDADSYPTEFVRGEQRTVPLAVENYEGDTVSYTLVVELQSVTQQGDQLAVQETAELDRTEFTVADGETWSEDVPVAPSATGEDLRLVFMLYADDPPENPSTDSAYRYTHVWIDVTDSDASDGADA